MSYFEDAFTTVKNRMGQEIGVSDWLTIDQPMIDAFADVTGDHQWVHVDTQRAANDLPYGKTFAHGFLTLSLASRLAYECTEDFPGQSMGLNYGMNKVRFLSPVLRDSRIRGKLVQRSADKMSETRYLSVVDLTIEIEGQDKPAMFAEWLTVAIFE